MSDILEIIGELALVCEVCLMEDDTFPFIEFFRKNPELYSYLLKTIAASDKELQGKEKEK